MKGVLIMLKVIIGFEDYEPWGQAVNFYNEIRDNNKLEVLECLLEDAYPEGITDTGINDLLAFDEDTVREWLDLPSEEMREQKIREEAFEWWSDEKEKYCDTKNVKKVEEQCDSISCLKDCPYRFHVTEFEDCVDYALAVKEGLSEDDIVALYKKENGLDSE